MGVTQWAWRPAVALAVGLTLALTLMSGRVGAAAAPPTGTVSGVVLEKAGGMPLGHVTVRLQSTGATVFTTDDGRFTFGEVAAGEQVVAVTAARFVLVRQRFTVVAGRATDLLIVLADGVNGGPASGAGDAADGYTESLDVTASAPSPGAPAVEGRIRGRELLQLSGGMANDPLRAVQVLPGVAASDDFRSEFAVRGSGPRQIGFVFEGLQTPVLLHTVQQVRDAGSIAMIGSQVIEDITLRHGSYAQRYGNRTGAELEFRMREGRRDRVRTQAMASLIDASAVVEGPLGRAGRGSWIASVRRSYMDLLLKRVFEDQRVSFAFADAQAKLVYDVSAANRLELAVTGGQSHLDLDVDEVRNPNGLATADSRGAVAVASWRLAPRPAWSLTQRAGVTLNQYENIARSGPALDAGRAQDGIYRVEWLTTPGRRLTLDGGGEARWSSGRAEEQRQTGGSLQLRENYRATSHALSAYGGATLDVTRRLSVSPGVRVDRWSLIDTVTTSPWLTARWQWPGAITLRGGWGLYQQAPGFSEARGLRGNAALRPERALQRDLGLEGPLAGGLRWQVNAYHRGEQDMLRRTAAEARLVNGRLVFAQANGLFVNALSGQSRGLEVLVERRRSQGLSGWLTYAWARTRYRDRLTGETFWGDYDQRHTFAAFATYRRSERLSVAARLRTGSNLPATGYWTEVGGRQYLTNVRNTLRVPVYGRLDLRVDRTFTWTERRLTLFVDLLNATRRRNYRFLPPSVNRATLEATGMFESLIPMVPSVGALFQF